MSKFTTEVRFICESAAGLKHSVGYDKIDEVLTEETINKVMPDYPLFDENYRYQLNKKILKYYYTREICAESVGLWRLWLDNKLNGIMPYYNQLYESELLKFDPLSDYKVVTKQSLNRAGTDNEEGTTKQNSTETHAHTSEYEGNRKSNNSDIYSETNNNTYKGERVGDIKSNDSVSDINTSEVKRTNNNTKQDAYSDTPQGGLSGVTLRNYLTNYREVTDGGNDTEEVNNTNNQNSISNQNQIDTENNSSNAERTGSRNNSAGEYANDKANANDSRVNAQTSVVNRNKTINSVESYVREVSGKMGSGSYAKLLLDFRKTMINIDMMIIEELSDLFFGLWE